jgi:hypothetical protein
MALWLVALSVAAGVRSAPSADPGPGGLCPQSAAARKVAREVVEAFGREALERGEARVARLVEAHGDEVARALRRTGPAGVEVLEKHGAAGVKILSRWGDDGLRVLAAEGDAAAEAFVRYGDDAIELMVRHPGVGRDLVGHFGEHALRAVRVPTEGVVQLNRLAPAINGSGRAAEILAVVERFGDRACGFLWRNKGTIFAAAILAAFLADPKPYLDGVKQLVTEPAADVAREAARRTNWTLVALAALGLGAAAWAVRAGWPRRRRLCP